MHVKARLFASLREKVGRDTIDLELPAGAVLADTWDALTAYSPEVEPYRESSMLALNRRYVPVDTALQDGDEVAVLPPVSGG